MCHNFHRLIDVLNVPGQPQEEQVLLHGLTLAMQHLRDAIALFSRYEISAAQLDTLEEHCKAYFILCREVVHVVTPTSWTIGHVVPVHARDLHKRFGFGLGLATAQGREAKILDVKKYGQHSLVKDMYKMIFRHEYMSVVALGKKDPQRHTYHPGKNRYVPLAVEKLQICWCGRQPDQVVNLICAFCREPLHVSLLKSIEEKKLENDLKQIMRPMEGGTVLENLLSYMQTLQHEHSMNMVQVHKGHDSTVSLFCHLCASSMIYWLENRPNFGKNSQLGLNQPTSPVWFPPQSLRNLAMDAREVPLGSRPKRDQPVPLCPPDVLPLRLFSFAIHRLPTRRQLVQCVPRLPMTAPCRSCSSKPRVCHKKLMAAFTNPHTCSKNPAIEEKNKKSKSAR